MLAVGLFLLLTVSTPDFTSSGTHMIIARNVGELGLIAMGLTIVLVAGGIDLSVGAMAGVANFVALIAFRVWGMSAMEAVGLAVLSGLLMGAVNGALIAGLKTRPFVTTLVTLMTYRTLVQFLQQSYSDDLINQPQDTTWKLLGAGRVGVLPLSFIVFLVLLVAVQLFLTRGRWGWRLLAVGASPKSARRNGVSPELAKFQSYVFSGAMCGLAGAFMATRQGNTSSNVGSGLELIALTAVVLGGVSLAGGRGSVVRATLGVAIVAMISQATLLNNLDSSWYVVILALALIAFTTFDLRFGKYRGTLAQKLAMNPGKLELGPLIDVTAPGTPWTINRRLTEAKAIGVGRIEGGEDVVIDRDHNVYCGDRRGWIWRFDGPDHDEGYIFARTGGMPLGLAWDGEDNLLCAVGGIGLVRIAPDGSQETLGAHTRKTWYKIADDSLVRAADDLDVAPDGSVYFSDFSSRYQASEYVAEILESRPNGRVLRWDPAQGNVTVAAKNYSFPNGVCTAHDGESILIAATLLCRVDRLWISGPKAGQIETVMENLPGYPDNINRASDGNYWLAFAGMRVPAYDVLLRHDGVRRRAFHELAADEWPMPQLNVSCVIKFTESGEVLNSLWDGSLENHSLITSVREHDGYLYIGGLQNNRIGRIQLDPSEVGDIDVRQVPGTQRAEVGQKEGRSVNA
ncbi:MAG: SMP-30/gluconolactonase/LRE family protein [Aeromicrobium sp.]|uniref:ABC transporter permease n=1 Tax=Aeromicrobium sp. TaxID=1871063 RepID=UPI00260EEBB5|nr:SMP-30/gluconolactonase/LRE family protein [Aeromicrobium sp.]MDF1705938.1 SMP-30/gluconolactonase/LRE family protein [Aeromicrobium sp.]